MGTADYTTDLGFEDNDNVTHLLAANCDAEAGDDLDLDDDGVLDLTPWEGIIDSVAIVEESGSSPSSSEWCYSDTTVGPNSLGDAPGHVYSCFGSWTIGPADPSGGDDSPGGNNYPHCASPLVAESEFRRGDPDGDGRLRLRDAVETLGYLFGRGPVLGCLQAADMNDDNAVSVADAIYGLSHLFRSAPAPAAPAEECGPDPTPPAEGGSALSCDAGCER